MSDSGPAEKPNRVCIELLDSSYGRPLQLWEFSDRRKILVGRSPDQDVPIQDTYVSRQHAELKLEERGWILISMGRHPVVIDGRTVETAMLGDETIFKLGSAGPVLRFRTGGLESGLMIASEQRMETMATNQLSVLQLGELETQDRNEKVGEIVNSEFFKMIREKANRLKQKR